MQKRRLSVIPSRRERIAGLCFLPFYLILLSLLLELLFSLLQLPSDAVLLNACYFAICAICVLLIFRSFLRENAKRFSSQARAILRALPGYLALYFACSYVLNLLVLTLQPDFSNQNNQALAGMMAERFPVMLLLSVLAAPLIEETLFRGLIFASLQPVSRPLAYLVTALCFSLIHVVGYLPVLSWTSALLSLAQYLPATLFFCHFYERSDNILAPMLFHGAVNLTSCLVTQLLGG